MVTEVVQQIESRFYERFGNISSWLISQPAGCSCFKNSPILDVRSIFFPRTYEIRNKNTKHFQEMFFSQERMKYVTKIQNTFKKCEGDQRLFYTKHNYCWKYKKVKVKVTLVQALRLCTGCTAHRVSRGIVLPFLDNGTRRGWEVSVTPRPFFTPRKDPVPIVQEAG